jgi:hypothetical protein
MRPIRLVLAGMMTGVVLCVLAAGALPVAASVGVGVDLAEIKVDEPLKPGKVYQLPAVGILNTGDEAGTYQVAITYMSDQPELAPPADWFQFDPQSFALEPQTSTKVAVSIHVPGNAEPGDYFALIEAHPVVEGGGGAAIGIAAATKLRFSVKKADSFFQKAAIYLYIALGIVAAVAVILLVIRFFPFRFKLEKR